MKSTILLVVAILVPVMALRQKSALSFDADDAKNRPVSKVITLLRDMLKQLEKEAEEDEQIYDKLACWCETNDKEKTQSISEAESRITALTTKIEELTANGARLSQELENLDKEVKRDQDSLDKATALREKQLAEFNGEEKDLLQSISALKAAIVVLSKHHPNSLLQMPQVATIVQHEMQTHARMLQGVLTHSERKVLEAFVQAPEDYFDASPTFKQSYAPQSGQIFGILRQMRETFESNLAISQKEEMANHQSFQELKAAKLDQIGASQAQINTKTQELATAEQDLAQSKEDIEDTRNSLSADEQFLLMLKEKCRMTDKEWEERQKTRHMEMEAVSKALAILSSDDAHDMFTRTFNPSLLQKDNTLHSARREEASNILSAAAKKANNPHLATLAVRVRLDAFTRVKKAIDDMIAELLKEKEDEIKHKDFCVDELNSNQLQTERKEREKEDFVAKAEAEESKIAELTQNIERLQAEIKESQTQLKRAGEDREKENQMFQLTVSDQRETQKLLESAVAVLSDFYARKGGFLQEPAGPPPPAGFKEYKESAASAGVVGLLEQIISDAKAMEAETIRAEEDAQKAYEDYVKDTNTATQQKNREIINKAEIKGQTEKSLVQTNSEKDSVVLELEQLSNFNAQLHTSCDFITKNFDVRQTARDEEVEALRQAKAILSGAKFGEFLQSA
jgi:uncharacterized small protein (DUF1192 family)